MLPPSQKFTYLSLNVDATDVAAQDAHTALLRAILQGPRRWGTIAVLLLVGGFCVWASTGLLAGGAIAPGVISPDGSRKTIQHLEPGIISEIMVRDGDYVETGGKLLTLENTMALATHGSLEKQYLALRARHARLTAERLGFKRLEFPKDLVAAAAGNADVTDILQVQRQLFAARLESLATRELILRQRVYQINEQIAGLTVQIASANQRVLIIDEELRGKHFLLERMLVPKPQVLALERTRTEITGDIGRFQAAIAEARQKISETKFQLTGLTVERNDEISRDLEKVRDDWSKVQEQLRTSEDTLKRTVIVAPVSGTVVNLRFKTRGGIVQSGEQILDIVPDKDELLIDAHVAPTDIDVVHAGLPAQVHLTALSNRRRLPRIEGTVRSVSADAMKDDKTGAPYYLARVEVDRQKLSDFLGKETLLIAGMPAEVLIVTGERTLFDYLLDPFRDIFRRALRES